MPRTIASFQRRYPQITVSLYESENQDLVQLLREGRVDMVVATIESDAQG